VTAVGVASPGAPRERVAAAWEAIEAAARPEVWITLAERAATLAEADGVARRAAAGEPLALA